MACPHAPSCPLFPLMNASLSEWRRYYCDSAAGFSECARYLRSRRGEVVPLGLLPNGHFAQHIQTEATSSATSGDSDHDEPTIPDAAPSSGWFEQQRRPPEPAPLRPAPRPIDVRPLSTPIAVPATGWWRRWWNRVIEWMERNV